MQHARAASIAALAHRYRSSFELATQEGVKYCLRGAHGHGQRQRVPARPRRVPLQLRTRTGAPAASTRPTPPTTTRARSSTRSRASHTRLRTSEYRDREEQFKRVLRMMQAQDASLPDVIIWDYSRLNFVHTGACANNLLWCSCCRNPEQAMMFVLLSV